MVSCGQFPVAKSYFPIFCQTIWPGRYLHISQSSWWPCKWDFAADPQTAHAKPHPSPPPPAKRVKCIKRIISSSSMLLHSFPFAMAVLCLSKLVQFTTSSIILSLMIISQAFFGGRALDPGLGPGQLLRMLWLLVLPWVEGDSYSSKIHFTESIRLGLRFLFRWVFCIIREVFFK